MPKINIAHGLFIETDEKTGKVTWNFDQPEAQGEIKIQPCAYGLDVYCPAVSEDYPIAMIDLAPIIRKGAPQLQAQIIIHSPAQRDELISRARFYTEQTLVDFENGVVPMPAADASGHMTYGIPMRGKYPSECGVITIVAGKNKRGRFYEAEISPYQSIVAQQETTYNSMDAGVVGWRIWEHDPTCTNITRDDPKWLGNADNSREALAALRRELKRRYPSWETRLIHSKQARGE